MIFDRSVHQSRPEHPANGQGNGRLLTVSQVARIMSAHPNSVRRWADMGRLPSYRIGFRGDRRFRADDVDIFLGSFDRCPTNGASNGITPTSNISSGPGI